MATKNLIWGLVILLMGLQFRTVESFVLTPKASRFVEEKLAKGSFLATDDPYGYRTRLYDPMLMSTGSVAQKWITPPRWLGWAMISVGAVLVLNGLTNRR